MSWVEMPEEKRNELIDESVEESVIEYGNTVLFSSARNEYDPQDQEADPPFRVGVDETA